MKYVMIEQKFKGIALRFPFIFPKELVHVAVSNAMVRVIEESFKNVESAGDAKPVSAGEVRISLDYIGGDSETLDLKSDPKDQAHIDVIEYTGCIVAEDDTTGVATKVIELVKKAEASRWLLHFRDANLEKPRYGESVLCKGESYDSDYDGGYFLARYMKYGRFRDETDAVLDEEGVTYDEEYKYVWVMGKQENNPTRITEWAYLPEVKK